MVVLGRWRLVRQVVIVRGSGLRSDHATVGEQITGIVEGDHAVAEQAPALLWVGRDHSCSVAVWGVR
jgi:hypothetical protein